MRYKRQIEDRFYGLIVLRSVPMGASYPVINAIVQPKLEREIRATYLSLQSLAGSLAFSSTLFLASWAVGDVATNTRPPRSCAVNY